MMTELCKIEDSTFEWGGSIQQVVAKLNLPPETVKNYFGAIIQNIL